MTEKTISLDAEAYDRLVAEKRGDESFSEVVKRLTRERSWTEVAGIWTSETDGVEAAIEDGGERSRGRRVRSVPEDDPLFSAPSVTVADPVDERDIDDVVYGSDTE